MVSELFDPAAWTPGRGLRLHRHHLPPGGRPRDGPHRVRPARGAQRVPPDTVDELYRALDHARQSPDVGCVLLTGNGPSPKDGGWAFCSGGDQRIRGRDGYRYAEGDDASSIDPARSRPPAHPRGAAAHPLHAQGRHRRRPGLGGRRRPQPARRLRPDARQRRARPLQADRRRRGQLRRRLRLGVPRPPGRPEVRPRDLLPRPASTPPSEAHADGHGQRGRAARRARAHRARSGPRRSTARARPRSACSSSRSTSSTTAWSASRCSPARPPASPTGPTRRPRAATRSSRSATPTGRRFPWHY